VDEESLNRAKSSESPFIANKIEYLLGKATPQPWTFDTSHFKGEFRGGDPRNRLDETVVTSLLYFAAYVRQEEFVRIIYRPGSSESARGWDQLLKIVTYCVLTLAYDVRKWSSATHFELDATIRSLLAGNASALRDFVAKRLGITLGFDDGKETNRLFPAEGRFDTVVYHRTIEFGPYLWRLLHFVAEAFALRGSDDDAEITLAKSLWRNFVCESLYRTLRCGYCMYHFKTLAAEMKARFTDESEDFSRAWFDAHNRVNAVTGAPAYSESEFLEDVAFARKALRSEKR
jgi:hypothetical protein